MAEYYVAFKSSVLLTWDLMQDEAITYETKYNGQKVGPFVIL